MDAGDDPIGLREHIVVEVEPAAFEDVDLNALEATARRLGFTPTRASSFPFPRWAGRAFPYNEFVLVAVR